MTGRRLTACLTVRRAAKARLLLAFAGLLAGDPARADIASERRFSACTDQVTQAQKAGVLYALDWAPPDEPRVVAGPAFFQLPIDRKQAFVESVNCYLLHGKGGPCVNFDVDHWKTGKPVGRYSFCLFRMKRRVVE